MTPRLFTVTRTAARASVGRSLLPHSAFVSIDAVQARLIDNTAYQSIYSQLLIESMAIAFSSQDVEKCIDVLQSMSGKMGSLFNYERDRTNISKV